MEMSDGSPTESGTTADQILDVAEALIQRRGYNAVSYGHLADELDLTTAAIHYHFPSKADLGQAVVARYRRANADKRAAIRAHTDTLQERLDQYVDLYANVLAEGGVCLCGVLAADSATLPTEVHREVQGFFEDQTDWLTAIFAEESDVTARLEGCESPRQAAELFLAAVEGAMLTHRTPRNELTAYRASLRCLIDTLAP
jgi:TetR/AcrR family transcriptional repressor of nem operon